MELIWDIYSLQSAFLMKHVEFVKDISGYLTILYNTKH